jgi:FlaA1/EpsC-like NDP-sugar epimerase
MFESFFINQALQKSTSFIGDEFLKKYQHHTILITGAGGSIGSKIVEELVKINFKNIVLLDHSELHLFKLKKKYSSLDFNYEIGDIRDHKKIDFIMGLYKPKLVIHAAAYKHVSLVENDMYELIRTNVEGTINVYTSSLKHKVSDFIFISTDKAVNPINNMGLSKMLAELFLKSYFNTNTLNTKIIRFGNVINSNGSVVPVFIDNIQNGAILEVRGEDVERYFIYDSVVAKSILNSSIENRNGMYLLEMNTPIKIVDLANYLNNLNQSKNTIKITSLGKKEKMTEELLNNNESIEITNDSNCYRIINPLTIDVEIRKEIIDIVTINKKFNSEFLNNKIKLVHKKTIL